MVFTKNVIAEQHEEVRDQIKVVLLKIETETELVQKDNLARGELIDSVRIWSILRNQDREYRWWSTEYEKLKCEFGENDPPEYWGDISLDTGDFIAGSTKYPWMPSDISNEEMPF